MSPGKTARCGFVMLLGSLLLVANGASAQTVPTVREGERVRVRYAPVASAAESNRTVAARMNSQGSVTGEFLHARGDSLALLTDSGVRSIPAASIARIERSTGTKTHTLQGALIGGGIMTALALLAGSNSDNDTDIVDDGGMERAAQGLMIGIGLLGGALIGHLSETEQWESATVPGVQVGIAHDRDAGVGVAASFSF